MLDKLTIPVSLAAILLASSPCWAISTVTVPASKDTSLFSDPARKPADRLSGSTEIFTTNRGGAFGFGGSASVSVGTPRFGSAISPGTPVINPAFPDSNPAFPDANSAFSNFPTEGAAADPTFGPSGAYAPRFNNKR
jgi:hypothetical protein